ncbi:restriction endonuclease subunit S [Cohnella sp. WQ 127256]|uniref:restriction endonuclease subunit S n=1 Tax=Cohnella sp. WQ 127256 TaxID=2938790 RepID=UPI0021181298|nr:restriction endonuclease subunit S [Cohnella sp. WQ 127256]
MSKKSAKSVEELLKDALVPEEEQPYKVPENWVWIKLSSCLEKVEYGYTASSTSDQVGPHYLRITDIQDNSVNWGSVPFCEISERDTEKYLLSSNDIVVARTGATTGKSYLIKEPPHSVFASYLIRLRTSSVITPEFLWSYMKSPMYWNQITVVKKGSAQPGANAQILGGLAVPLPSLNEQKRIADKVKRLLDKINQAKQLIESIPSNTLEIRQAILKKAFQGELTRQWRKDNNVSRLTNWTKDRTETALSQSIPIYSIPNEWNWALSKDLFSFVTSGSRGWAQYYSETGPLFIRIGNLNRNSIEIDLTSEQHVSPPDGAEGTRTKVQRNDILVSITGDVGMIGLVPDEFPDAYINQHVALARPLQGICPEYVACFFASREGGYKQFLKRQRGATKAGLGLEDIRSIWVPLPSFAEQKEIVNKINSLFTTIDYVDANRDKINDIIEFLPQSIMTKAFRGDLDTNYLTEENAMDLLEQIVRQ